MKKLLLLLFFILSALSARAKIRTEELSFKPSIIQYYHAGSKVHIIMNSLPYHTEQVIVSAINSDKRPKAFIIGKRQLKVANDGSIEFTIELEDLKPGTYNTKSSAILLTLYSYENDKLVIDQKSHLYIRPIICSDQGDGLCATVETECHKGRQNCQAGTEDKTFKNLCEMKKHGGIMLHAGACLE